MSNKFIMTEITMKDSNAETVFELSQKIDYLYRVVADLQSKMPETVIKTPDVVSVYELSQKIDYLYHIVSDLQSKIQKISEFNPNGEPF